MLFHFKFNSLQTVHFSVDIKSPYLVIPEYGTLQRYMLAEFVTLITVLLIFLIYKEFTQTLKNP